MISAGFPGTGPISPASPKTGRREGVASASGEGGPAQNTSRATGHRMAAQGLGVVTQKRSPGLESNLASVAVTDRE